MKKDIRIIRKYFSLINADKKYLIKYIIILIFSNIYNMIIPLIYGNIISNTMANLYKMAYILLIVYLLTYLIGSLIKYLEWKTYARFFKKIYMNLQNKAIDALYKMPIYKLTSEERGKSINIVTEDINSISHYFESVILEIMDIILIIFIPIILFIIDIYIGLLVIIITILNTYFLGKYNNKIEKIKTKRKKYLDLRTSFVTGIINGLKDIKILNLDKKLYTKYQKINNKFTNTFIKEIDVRAIKSVIIPMFIFIVESIIIGISIYFISIKRVGIEHLVIIISYYTILNEKIREVLYMSEDLRNINININRVEKLNDYANNNPIAFGSNNKDDIKGIIEFKNVSFGYNKELVLKNINIKILPNTVTAIVGKSGCGKSTIYNLLLRFCKPKKGIIKIDDINIMNYDTDTYLHNISAVSQDAYIFGDTIRNNLSLIEKDFNKIVKACKRAHIHDFIMSLPKGYDTVLGDNASSLSGGQKQRLSIARTLLKKAEIILFDEVTSALDTTLRKEITNEIYDLKKDHTIIMISHKIEEVTKADQIVLIDNGIVVGTGTHEELLNNKHYRKIFDLE